MKLKNKAEFEENMRLLGVGRHVLGSHIYDYWHDPYGRVHNDVRR